MLVFISDLHFVDGTAGKHNVPMEAFDGVLRDLKTHAENAKAKEIKIVFLGDIFDILRTEMWFKVDEDKRPWGENESEDHAKKILNKVISKNQATFDIFKGSLKDDYGFNVEPERIYIPGNHDRLCNKYESLRAVVRENLGITGKVTGEQFDCYYLNPDYGVLARHGHEFDEYNYEGGKAYSFKDYMCIPLGDPITTELVAKLPLVVKQRLEEENFPQDDIKLIYTHFQDIENVRPFGATIDWLFYQVQSQKHLKEIIEDAVDKVAQDFEELSFVQKWYKRHDKWYKLMDEADKVQIVLGILSKFKVTSAEKLLNLIDKSRGLWSGHDEHIEAAVQEYSNLDTNIVYIVYGHTHEPKQVPLQVIHHPSGEIERVYLNTGTWRARHRHGEHGDGFITWKDLTYVILYNKDESPSVHAPVLQYPTFETWSGALKEE